MQEETDSLNKNQTWPYVWACKEDDCRIQVDLQDQRMNLRK